MFTPLIPYFGYITDLFQVYPDFLPEDSPENPLRREKSGMLCVLMGVTIRIVLDLAKFHVGEFLKSRPGCVSLLGNILLFYITSNIHILYMVHKCFQIKHVVL